MKKLLYLFLLVISMVLLVSCDSKTSVEGTYYFESISYGDTTYKVGDSFKGTTLTKDDIKITFKDGKYTITFNATLNAKTSQTGTYTKSGSGYKLTSDGVSIQNTVAKFDGNKVTITEDTVTMVLSK